MTKHEEKMVQDKRVRRTPQITRSTRQERKEIRQQVVHRQGHTK